VKVGFGKILCGKGGFGDGFGESYEGLKVGVMEV